MRTPLLAIVICIAMVPLIASESCGNYELLLGPTLCYREPGQQAGELELYGLIAPSEFSPIPLPGIEVGAVEYTFVIEGMLLSGLPGTFQRHYSNGNIELWADEVPDASASCVPSGTYSDGRLLLRGIVSAYSVLDFTIFGSGSGIISARVDWIEGESFGLLASLGATDAWETSAWFEIDLPGPPGYTTLFSGRMEREAASPVEPTTWGAVKALYRHGQ